MIGKGEIAVIRTSMPECPYYLAELLTDIYITEKNETDVYGHTIPPNERVAKCRYLETHSERKDGTLYYFEAKKIAYYPVW